MDPISENIRAGYDQVAAEYAAQYFHELDHKPLDRQYLDRFIEAVSPMQRAGDPAPKPVCDMGCGPGEIARYLSDHGLDPVIGVDLSESMARQARLLSPQVSFQVGNMLCLDVPDAAWVGIAAFYSIVHIPRAQVVDALKELKRVLAPGGLLLMSFHINQGENEVHLDEYYGKPVSMDWVLFTVAEMQGYFQQAGFTSVDVLVREPYPDIEHQGPRAYFFARRP